MMLKNAMSNTPFVPVLLRRESVQTWVTSQWKNPPLPGQISMEINTLHTKLDGKRLQMLSYVTMLSPQQSEYVRARPPWEGETGASS
jgi:hypothetical protein